MSTIQDNNNDIVRVPESNEVHHQLCLYYVRVHDTKAKLKLQADFGNHINFIFSEGKHLYDKDNFGPIVYTLDLNLKMDNSRQLYVQHKEQFKPIDKYQLTMSYVTGIGKTFCHEEKRDAGHSLLEYFDTEHLFLFDINFSPYYRFHLPGKKTYKIKTFFYILF
jgi:hypothetical protein